MAKVSGIYVIENTVTGKRYVGSSADCVKRRGRHWLELRNGVHRNRHLQRAWNKYGEDVFEFSVIEECEKESLLDREQTYIDSIPDSYNIAKIAGKGPDLTGRKWSPEATAKRVATVTGRKYSPEHCRHISESLKGRDNTVATEAARIANTGRKATPEHRQKISDALKGKPKSAESIAKMRATKTGKKRGPHSAEHREHLRLSMLAAVQRRKAQKQEQQNAAQSV